MTYTTNEKKWDVWYLEFSVSRHICNNKYTIVDLQSKTYNFVIVGNNIIKLEQVGTVISLFKNSLEFILTNIAYTPKYNCNLISLGQLKKIGISYHNQSKYGIEIKEKEN